MMNYKSAKKHEMISKARENFSKNERSINIRDDFFQKICCLLTIETKNNHNLKSRSFKFLKFLTFIFFSSIKFTEFFISRFNTFFLHYLNSLNFLSLGLTRLLNNKVC